MGIYEFDAEVYEKVIREESREDGYAEGKAAGLMEGESNGEFLTLIKQACRKLSKNKSVEVIAQELEEDAETIRGICSIAADYAPEYDAKKILAEYKKVYSI